MPSLRRWTGPAVALLFALVVVLAAGCGDRVPPATESTQQARAATDELLAREGFPCRTLRVTTADGTVTDRCVWVADTPALSDRGLMGVTDPMLGGRGAMVFAPGADSLTDFWMVDTLVPLTLVWIDAAGSVIGSADMEPCTSGVASCQRFRARVPWRLAVEVPIGTAAGLGLVPGSRVELLGDC